jgi:hypothetical protein
MPAAIMYGITANAAIHNLKRNLLVSKYHIRFKLIGVLLMMNKITQCGRISTQKNKNH